MFVYYESIKRELKTRPIYECRCDERLKTKAEESTHGWVCVLEVIGAPSMLRLTLKAAALARVLPTISLNCAENAARRKWNTLAPTPFFYSFCIFSFLYIVYLQQDKKRRRPRVNSVKLFNRLYFFFAHKGGRTLAERPICECPCNERLKTKAIVVYYKSKARAKESI